MSRVFCQYHHQKTSIKWTWVQVLLYYSPHPQRGRPISSGKRLLQPRLRNRIHPCHRSRSEITDFRYVPRTRQKLRMWMRNENGERRNWRHTIMRHKLIFYVKEATTRSLLWRKTNRQRSARQRHQTRPKKVFEQEPEADHDQESNLLLPPPQYSPRSVTHCVWSIDIDYTEKQS